MNNKIYDTLIDLGYNPILSGGSFRVRALYRGGDGNSVAIDSEDGHFIDFVSNQRGQWHHFLELACDGNKQLIEKYSNGEFEVKKPERNYLKEIMQEKVHPEEMLEKLIPFYDFYLDRNISKTVLQRFECGLATSGKLRNRIVFPIRNPRNRSIIGFSGRLLQKDMAGLPKWIHINSTKNRAYPLHLSGKAIKETRTVILVESIGDCLALFEAKVENVGVTFGLQIPPALLKEMISCNVKTVKIALNNDNNQAGQKAATEMQKQLSQYFDDIRIITPMANDWGETPKEQIQEIFNEKN